MKKVLLFLCSVSLLTTGFIQINAEEIALIEETEVTEVVEETEVTEVVEETEELIEEEIKEEIVEEEDVEEDVIVEDEVNREEVSEETEAVEEATTFEGNTRTVDTTGVVVTTDVVDITDQMIIINDQSPKVVTITGRFDNRDYDLNLRNTQDAVITVDENYNGKIILKDVYVDVHKTGVTYSNAYIAALLVNGSGEQNVITNNVDIVLEGTTSLRSGRDRAGLEVWRGAQINISGSGTLNAYNGAETDETVHRGSAAGIGQGDVQGSGGDIVIKSGTINAYGGEHGAGIGGAWTSAGEYSGKILIFGGVINSYGGDHGAGIGGGCANSLYGRPNDGVIVALPPAQISATSTGRYETLGEMNTSVYVGDPRSPKITVRTSEYTKNADIYMNLINVTDAVETIKRLGVDVSELDITRVPIGKTDENGIAYINMDINHEVNFYTETLSADGLTFKSEEVIANDEMEIVLQGPTLDVAVTSLTKEVPALTVGYEIKNDQNDQTIQIKNTGNQEVTDLKVVLAGLNNEAFDIVAIDKTALQTNEVANVTVRPVNGLVAGSYVPQLSILAKTVDGTGGAAKEITLSSSYNGLTQEVKEVVKVEEKKETKTPETPKTGIKQNSMYPVILVVALVGLLTLVRRKKSNN